MTFVCVSCGFFCLIICLDQGVDSGPSKGGAHSFDFSEM